MTSIAVAETETALTQVLETEPLTIGVSVDPYNNLRVSDNFVRVAEYGSREITWELQLSPGDSRTIVFDNPPIRILSSPDQAQPLLVPIHMEQHSVTFRWVNDNPALFGMSFAYRVHAVICNGNGTFTPVQSDPIIRNDPPPAP